VKKTNLLFVALVASTLFFIVFIIIRSRNLPRTDFSATGDNWLQAWNRYVTYSTDRWGGHAMAMTNDQWVSFATNSERFIYYNQEGDKLVQVSARSSHLTSEQISYLMTEILSFFKTYSNGSYDTFLKFHQRSLYTLVFGDFSDDESFTNWAATYKKPFGTPDEKLKTLWEYPLYERTRGLWFTKKIKEDEAAGHNVSLDLQSPYISNLYKQFDTEFAGGKVDEFPELKMLAISPSDYEIYLIESTNETLPLSNFLNRINKGAQLGGHHIFIYSNTTESIINKQGYCNYALVTASVLVNSCNCYVPIAASFYWSPADNAWLPFKMGRLSKGDYHVLF
jgi:hypothetical protein